MRLTGGRHTFAFMHSLAFMVAAAYCTEAIAIELQPEFLPEQWDGREFLIDPDFGLYGIPFGSSQSDVRATFGDPQGIFVVNKDETILIYGRTHLLTIKHGRLTQVTVRDHALKERFGEEVPEHPVFDGVWRLEPGLRRNMSREDIIVALNEAGSPMGAGNKIEFERSTLVLRFYSSYHNGETIFSRLVGFYLTYHGGQLSSDCPCDSD